MGEPWYDYPDGHGYITQYEGAGTDTPHFAFDLQTPFHTELTAPTSGTVKVADYQAWGGEIFVQPDDKSLPEWYMYHPDQVDVHVGEHVNAGQEIGLSGGENPGYPGAEHPAQPQWSSGPHTHVGWFTKWTTPSQTGETIPYGPDPTNLIAIAKGSGGASANVPSNVYNAVEPVAQKYGVPDAVWEDIVQVESGFNTSAVGDNGTSYGIFQLHEGGQFPSQYLSNPTALDDPGLNAQYAMPDIGKAWQNLSATFDPNSPQWWEEFAAQSGHPGGSPGETVTDNEAAKLQADYEQFANGSSAQTLADTQSTCQRPSGWNAINPGAWVQYGACQAQNAVAGSAQAAAGDITSWIGSTIGPFMVRVGVGAAGLVAIWLGGNEIVGALKGESGGQEIAENKQKAEKAAAPDKQTGGKSKAKSGEKETEADTESSGAGAGAGESGAAEAGAAGGEASAAELAALA